MSEEKVARGVMGVTLKFETGRIGNLKQCVRMHDRFLKWNEKYGVEAISCAPIPEDEWRAMAAEARTRGTPAKKTLATIKRLWEKDR